MILRGRLSGQRGAYGGPIWRLRPAQPDELAPSYVFLASEGDSSYITGIILPVLGGETIGG